jgi:putative transposase
MSKVYTVTVVDVVNEIILDAAFGQFFTTLDYIASKAGAAVVNVNPAYTSMLLAYRDEFVFTDCSIREYFDPQQLLYVDRDINAAINIKRVGLELFPTINRRSGKIGNSKTHSTAKQVLETLKGARSPHHTCTQVGAG